MMPVNVTLPDGIDNNELPPMIVSHSRHYHLLCCKGVDRWLKEKQYYKDGNCPEAKKLNYQICNTSEAESAYHSHHSSKDSISLSSRFTDPKDIDHEFIYSSGHKYQNIVPSNNLKNSVSLMSYSKINDDSLIINKDNDSTYEPTNIKTAYVSQQYLTQGNQSDTNIDYLGYLPPRNYNENEYKSSSESIDLPINENQPELWDVSLSNPSIQNNSVLTIDPKMLSLTRITSSNPSLTTIKEFCDIQPTITNPLCIPKKNLLDISAIKTSKVSGYLSSALDKTNNGNLISDIKETFSSNINNKISKPQMNPAQLTCNNIGYVPQTVFHKLRTEKIHPVSEEYSQLTFNQNKELANQNSVSDEMIFKPQDKKSMRKNNELENHYSRISLKSFEECEKETSDNNLTNLIIENKLYTLNNILEGLPEQPEKLKTSTIYDYKPSRIIGRESEKYFSLPQSEQKMASCI